MYIKKRKWYVCQKVAATIVLHILQWIVIKGKHFQTLSKRLKFLSLDILHIFNKFSISPIAIFLIFWESNKHCDFIVIQELQGTGEGRDGRGVGRKFLCHFLS